MKVEIRWSLTIIASAGWFGLVWYVGRGFCIGLFFPSLSRDQHWLCNTSPHRGASLLLPPPPHPTLTWLPSSWQHPSSTQTTSQPITFNMVVPLRSVFSGWFRWKIGLKTNIYLFLLKIWIFRSLQCDHETCFCWCGLRTNFKTCPTEKNWYVIDISLKNWDGF